MEDLIELGPDCHETYFCGDQYAELSALGMPVAGLSTLRGHYRVEQQLRVHLVACTLEGGGRAAAGPFTGALRRGGMLCVPAGTAFRLQTDADAPWSTVWLHLDARRWRPFPASVECRDGVDATPVAALLGLLDAERECSDTLHTPLKRTLGEALALQLRRLLQNDASTGASRSSRAALQAIFDRVRAQPAEDWSAERLASLAGCSRSQLHRRCVEAFGRSPAAQVTHLRMREAEYWLTATGVPLKVVADRLGYASPYHFSTAFKRFSGVPPAVYRAGTARNAVARSGRGAPGGRSP